MGWEFAGHPRVSKMGKAKGAEPMGLQMPPKLIKQQEMLVQVSAASASGPVLALGSQQPHNHVSATCPLAQHR